MINFKLFKNGIIYFFYLLIITLIGSEIIIRNSSKWIPDELVEYLSPKALESIISDRGQIEDKNPPVYHYRPFQKLNWYPHITIDENGYRNSAINQTEVDIVILGDSITFAKDSKVEIGDLFREEGLSALNLGMSGYGPQYYRDVYKKYVIEKGIKHKNVIVNIFVGNDFSDAVRYPSFKLPTSKGKAYYPWIINLMIGAFDLQKNIRAYDIDIKESAHKISLPYKKIGIRYLWWTPEPSDIEWKETEKALNEIIDLAKHEDARVSFVIIPSPASVYGEEIYPDFINFVERHNKIINQFREIFNNIDIIDLNKKLAKEIEKEFLYIAESDCHFNTYGTKIFFDIINKQLKIKT